jgi:hypothetical protein
MYELKLVPFKANANAGVLRFAQDDSEKLAKTKAKADSLRE